MTECHVSQDNHHCCVNIYEKISFATNKYSLSTPTENIQRVQKRPVGRSKLIYKLKLGEPFDTILRYRFHFVVKSKLDVPIFHIKMNIFFKFQCFDIPKVNSELTVLQCSKNINYTKNNLRRFELFQNSEEAENY